METAVIVAAQRTPIGRFLGGLSTITAPKLGAEVIGAILERTHSDPKHVDEVIMGNVLQAGLGQNPARQAALAGGVPPEVGAVTINKVCGSGLKSVMLAAQAIRLGDANLVVAGGFESMSQAPYLLPGVRTGHRLGHGQVVDSMVHDGLWDCHNDFHMGSTAELVAQKYKVSREAQDEYALGSQQKAVTAQEGGLFKDEIIPITVKGRRGDTLVEADEGPRKDTTMERLASLKPAFEKNGTVTAGNASTINDGAAAVLVASSGKAKELGLPVLATIDAYAVAGMEPKWVMMAPVRAVGNLFKNTGEKIDDFDLFELNEAFAVQAVAVTGELGMPLDKVNVNGGAVALGHPIGASGARVLVTLIHALRRRDGGKGLATLCLGGGNAVAMSVTV
ncbi:MAG: acetyl-CoA C-acetyltransferase [Candidatus Krumholzibacteria bacterium]|nr:acetyl-CoA C-acetyltransferase [Candidatus Krumholzibacteria bacterium]